MRLRLRHFVTIVLGATMTVGGFATPAGACSCRTGIPACETFWRAPAVFSALVLDIEPAPGGLRPDIDSFPDRRVRLQVERSWRGNASGIVTVRTGTGGGDCGYDFIRGERYLVYVEQRGAELFVSICGRTRPLADAAEDLAYLKTAFEPSAVGRILGTVRYQRRSHEERARPVAGYPVRLHSATQQWKTTTRGDGSYEFRVPAGKYNVKVDAPDTEHVFGPSTIELADPRGCASADFNVVPDGRIAVSVVDADGKPLSGVAVEFVKLDTMTGDRMFPESRPVTTRGDGVAEARQLHPDRYIVGVNVSRVPEPRQPYPRLFYPGVADHAAALVIDLRAGERLELDPFVLPARLEEHRLSGVVVRPDGSPAAAADVSLRAVPERGRRYAPQVGVGVRTDKEGRFTVVALGGRRYRIHAFLNVKDTTGRQVQWSAESVEIDAEAPGGALTLTLAPPTGRR